VNLSEPFIRRPVMTILLTVTIILFGVIAYRSLPVNDLPAVDYPVITVSVGYPGASPETMANNVATPLERQFMQIPGIDLITSKSTQGMCSLTLQFNLSKSLDAAATDVQTAISQAGGSLPVDLPSPPIVSKTNPNDQAIMYIALVSDSATQGKVYDFANTQVGQRISILPGVSRVVVYGTKSAIRIKVDPSALATRGIAVDDLAAAVQAGTSYQGAGQFDGPNRTFLVTPKGQLETADQYRNLVVANRNGAPVFLKDVANVIDGVQDERVNMRFWARGVGMPSATVVVAVFRQAGVNAVEVSKEVRKLVPIINAELPGSMVLIPTYDRSVSIVHSINDVQATLYIAFALVVIVIFVFLGRAKDTLIPAVALPLSILITFLVMWALNYSLDNLSLMALTLAIGFLVDDAIVFLENTVRRMEEGESALSATFSSAKQISFTILSMTISLAAVFLPLVLMPGLMGRIFREFSVTIIVSIFASGLVSLTLTPLMCSRLLAQRGKGSKKTLMERIAGDIERRILAVYGWTLTIFLRHRWVSLAIWILCLVGTIQFLKILPKSFLPIGDSGFATGFLMAQEGASPERMKSYQVRAEKAMQDNPAVETTFSLTGNGQFLFSNQGLLLAFLKDRKEREPIAQVSMEMMGAASNIPGVMAFFRPVPVLQISTGAASLTQGQFSYSLSGVNPEEVYETANKLLAKLYAFDGFAGPPQSDYFSHTPNLSVDIDRNQASMYGVSVGKIENLLRNAYSQNYLYLIKRPTDQYQVIMEVDDKGRTSPENLSLLYVRSDDGAKLVPLDAVVHWKPTLGAQAVNHINQFTSVTISFNLKPGVPIGNAIQFVENAAKDVVPITVRGTLQGEALTFRDTMSSLTILMILAVFIMYVILGILYESYLHPLTVLSSLPVALVGGLATLWLFGEEASLYAFVGMFMLMGIVKKNGIMIVDFARHRVMNGENAEKAIHDASMDRFRPIIMTTLAAIMGALPIALGYGEDGGTRRPLGLVIVGGLIVSQFITLYITPVIYLYLEDFQEKVLDRTTFFRSTHKHQQEGMSLAQREALVPVAVGEGNGSGNGHE
jgi:hydrophobic/amphiphilic exporter-1 (mainly G- bacteria), HAE1 family